MIKPGMMIINDTVGLVGRVIYTDETTTAVQEFAGAVHEVATDDCKEVGLWVRWMAWMHIAKRLRKFFVHRIVK